MGGDSGGAQYFSILVAVSCSAASPLCLCTVLHTSCWSASRVRPRSVTLSSETPWQRPLSLTFPRGPSPSVTCVACSLRAADSQERQSSVLQVATSFRSLYRGPKQVIATCVSVCFGLPSSRETNTPWARPTNSDRCFDASLVLAEPLACFAQRAHSRPGDLEAELLPTLGQSHVCVSSTATCSKTAERRCAMKFMLWCGADFWHSHLFRRPQPADVYARVEKPSVAG